MGTFDAGAADGSGRHTLTIPYQAISDEDSHTYDFSSRGTDGRGNVELAPSIADLSFTRSLARPAELELSSVDIQRGARQRSFIQYVDLQSSDNFGHFSKMRGMR